mmetsp:Transcript_17190/g.26565  ORF Transcript_17190/g.26565 Transcript_17190/m.26565 type:complete len:108 (+) Transcript_17190:187-510(+)
MRRGLKVRLAFFIGSPNNLFVDLATVLLHADVWSRYQVRRAWKMSVRPGVRGLEIVFIFLNQRTISAIFVNHAWGLITLVVLRLLDALAARLIAYITLTNFEPIHNI